MKLVTWNVNSLKVRLPRVLELLEAHSPDVVMLQETKCAPEAFPELELEAAGYRAVHHSGGRWAGVAILAREEPADEAAGLPGEPAVASIQRASSTAGSPGNPTAGSRGSSRARIATPAQRPPLWWTAR